MANGRLGKQVVSSQQTVELYKNTSGSSAAVSVHGHSQNGTEISLMVDDSTDTLNLSTTLATEAYDERYLKYDATNTKFTEPTPAYQGRLQFREQVNNATINMEKCFEYFDNVNSTTYTHSTSTASLQGSTGMSFFEHGVYLAEKAAAGKSAYSTLLAVDNGPNINYYPPAYDETYDVYYARRCGITATGRHGEAPMGYNDTGVSIDPYEFETPYAISMNASGFASITLANTEEFTSSPAIGQGSNRTSDSPFYAVTGGYSVGPQASATHNVLLCRAQKRVHLWESGNTGSRMVISTSADSYWDRTTYNHIQVGDNVIYNQNCHMFFLSNLNDYTGGKVLGFEYNPHDERYYVIMRSHNQFYVWSFTRSGLLKVNQGSSTSITRGTDNSTYDVIWHDFTLTPSSPYAAGDQNLTGRTMRIADKTWALVLSYTNNDNTAPDVLLSNDLKVWKSPADYYGTDDYKAIVDVTTITSNSGTVTASKTNYGNLGKEGALETNTTFTQYERTGLVLNNNDRIVAYNSGSNDVSLQVMGYEGD